MTTTKPSNARQIGKLMCTVTEQVLWSPSHNQLICRVGSGQATYHRFDPGTGQHQITYGAKMIEAKYRPETAGGWLSGREIQQRGYFDGELSPLNLLAHTCCHEFAHLLQHNASQRFRGSVHNRHFYRILDDLHTSGRAKATRTTLADLAERQGLALSPEGFELPELTGDRSCWAIGDAVAFATGRGEKRGEILRVNRKTCTVRGTGFSRGVRYRVPMQLLRKTAA
ncbi:hypothetical protein [Marinobacter halotolerans]|uniref:hypothetical protein n=1 Tax=Marinobacter halotolerans TaxID=1569211 RepID=UPI0012453AAA|nr:hypothetical protein [Marinobacter halotolerans]